MRWGVHYARGGQPGLGYRNGYRMGRLKTAEGAVQYAAPQIADRGEPFRSQIRAILGQRTGGFGGAGDSRCMRVVCPRDIEALFADEAGQSLLSRTAVSEITERLWAEYEAFASRDLSEFELVYLFVDGIAERLHLGQPCEAVLAAWGILADGKKALLHLTPGSMLLPITVSIGYERSPSLLRLPFVRPAGLPDSPLRHGRCFCRAGSPLGGLVQHHPLGLTGYHRIVVLTVLQTAVMRQGGHDSGQFFQLLKSVTTSANL